MKPLIQFADLGDVDLESMKKSELIEFIEQQNKLYQAIAKKILDDRGENKALTKELSDELRHATMLEF